MGYWNIQFDDGKTGWMAIKKDGNAYGEGQFFIAKPAGSDWVANFTADFWVETSYYPNLLFSPGSNGYGPWIQRMNITVYDASMMRGTILWNDQNPRFSKTNVFSGSSDFNARR